MAAMFIAPNVTVDDANKKFQPLVSIATNATGGAVLYTTSAYGNFMEWWKAFFQTGALAQVGGNVEVASRLLPRELAEEHPEEVARIALSLGVATKYVCFFFSSPLEHLSNACRILIRFFFFFSKSSVAGGAVSRVDPESTGLNPSWRKAIAQVFIGETWKEGADSATILAARERLKQGTDVLDKLTKDSGSYLNEVRTISIILATSPRTLNFVKRQGSLYERDFKKSYFGSHYPKLKKIKETYDPSSLFVVASGVGSDEWDAELRCRK